MRLTSRLENPHEFSRSLRSGALASSQPNIVQRMARRADREPRMLAIGRTKELFFKNNYRTLLYQTKTS